MDAQKILDDLLDKHSRIEAWMIEHTGPEEMEIVKQAIEYGRLYEQIKQKLKASPYVTPLGPLLPVPGMR